MCEVAGFVIGILIILMLNRVVLLLFGNLVI